MNHIEILTPFLTGNENLGSKQLTVKQIGGCDMVICLSIEMLGSGNVFAGFV